VLTLTGFDYALHGSASIRRNLTSRRCCYNAAHSPDLSTVPHPKLTKSMLPQGTGLKESLSAASSPVPSWWGHVRWKHGPPNGETEAAEAPPGEGDGAEALAPAQRPNRKAQQRTQVLGAVRKDA
jgi:hypothetical protein